MELDNTGEKRLHLNRIIGLCSTAWHSDGVFVWEKHAGLIDPRLAYEDMIHI